MKIGILAFRSRDPEPAIEDLKLVKAAQDLGHEALLIPAWECSVHYGESEKVLWKGASFPTLDLLIPRARFIEYSELHLHLLEVLERSFFTLNKAASIAAAKNKIKTLERLSVAGLPIPKSMVIDGASGLEELSFPFTLPVVLKPPYGTFGEGICLAASLDEIREYSTSRFIIQEFIAEAEGKDLRVFVVGDEVIAAMERKAQPGEFRANVELGASVHAVQISDEVARLAILAVKALKLDYAGVDIIESKRGPLVLEVNANPGFKSLEKVSSLNIAETLIQFAVRRSR